MPEWRIARKADGKSQDPLADPAFRRYRVEIRREAATTQANRMKKPSSAGTDDGQSIPNSHERNLMTEVTASNRIGQGA